MFQNSDRLVQGATSVWAYFPSAIFYDFYTGQQGLKFKKKIKKIDRYNVNFVLLCASVSNKSQWLNLSAPPTYIPLHIRGGSNSKYFSLISTCHSCQRPRLLNSDSVSCAYYRTKSTESLSASHCPRPNRMLLLFARKEWFF